MRECFGRLYGPDLVQTLKEGTAYYQRVFADAGVKPEDALVIDDRPIAIGWAVEAGARAVLVNSTSGGETPAAISIGSLAELPGVIERFA